MNHNVILTDLRDGCTYERDYLNSPDWSINVADMADMVMDAYPEFSSPRNRIGDGNASGPLFDVDGREVGRYESMEIIAEGAYEMTRTEIRSTDQLRTGDVVLNSGMRLVIDQDIKQTRHADNGYGPTFATRARIDNFDVLRADAQRGNTVAQFIVGLVNGDPEHQRRNNRPVDTEPRWTIQGNSLARWAVVVPNIDIGTVFNTQFESGCIALSAPDTFGNFDGIDSDGITVQFSTTMVTQHTTTG